MRRGLQALGRPLDGIFSSPSHVAVLRGLMDSREGMSGRAVARASGVNHQACAVALRRLEGLGVVLRQGSGATQLARLNPEHYVVRELLLPLLRKERELPGRIRGEIAARFGGRALSATLFGSAARGEAGPASDLDMLLIVPARRKEAAADEARSLSAAFIRRYGIRLSPIVMTLPAVRKRAAEGDPLIRNILREGVGLAGRKLAELLA